MSEEMMFNTGAIYGAITDVNSERARNHAMMYYEEIRHRKDDVDKIAQNTEFTHEQVLRVKSYLFLEKHILQENEEPKYFDPCFEIAESWRRLASNKNEIKPHDLILIKHEIMEQTLILTEGMSQEEAHNKTNQKYNYTEASDNYYYELSLKISHKETNGGAIRRKLSHSTH